MEQRALLISEESINIFLSSIRQSTQKSNEARQHIKTYSQNVKELDPIYSLINVEFNPENRSAKIEIREKKEYRTIDRYVTQNYVRYPVLSYWKEKSKRIKKTIKLTNSELETLNFNEDNLINFFAPQIIISLNNKDLYPSWLLRDILKEEKRHSFNLLDKKLTNYINQQQAKINDLNAKIENINNYIQYWKTVLLQKEKRAKKINNSLNKIETSKNRVLKSLISFGVYGYLIGKKRKNRILIRMQQNKQIQGIINKNIFYKENEIKTLKALISFYNKNIKNTCTYLALIKRLANLVYEKKLQSITSLPVHYEPDNSFIPLKTIIGVKYEKIIGVYVIHNKENNKYYVGQSKDIYKRLKQHFVGTVPKNVIFARDYYFSKSENKSDLFEVKIIPCGTKDELDKTEKNLIELYDSYNLGYNGTNGNT